MRSARLSAIAAAIRGLIRKPLSDSVIADSNRSRHFFAPWSAWAISSIRRTPGVPIERPLARADGIGARRSVALMYRR